MRKLTVFLLAVAMALAVGCASESSSEVVEPYKAPAAKDDAGKGKAPAGTEGQLQINPDYKGN
jgi:hypothetical protein